MQKSMQNYSGHDAATDFLTDLLANEAYGQISGNNAAIRQLMMLTLINIRQMASIAAALDRLEANLAFPHSNSPVEFPPSAHRNR